jgi:hypothetical protein
MRPSVIVALALVLGLLAPVAAEAGTPIALAERQVVSLEFVQPVARLAVTDLEVVGLEADGARVRVTGLRGGRAELRIVFADGAIADYDLTVAAVSRPAKANGL